MPVPRLCEELLGGLEAKHVENDLHGLDARVAQRAVVVAGCGALVLMAAAMRTLDYFAPFLYRGGFVALSGLGALIVLAPPAGTGARFADRLIRQMLKQPVGPPFNGRLAPGPYAGGAIALDLERAVRAIETHLAAPMGLTPIDDEALLDEVTALVERANVMMWALDSEFLAVPAE